MCAVSNREPLRRELPLNTVDLWFATLPENDFSLQALLSSDEMHRVSRFRFDRDAANFVARRGILRLILAGYTRVAPARLRFNYSEFGKPALDSCCDIRFSASHSDQVAVYAVASQ